MSIMGRSNDAFSGLYRIGRELSEGWMATGYLVQDLEHDRKVATKVGVGTPRFNGAMRG